ncbi:hypothetical protein RYX36_012859 [Vicia faba]
MNTNLQPSITEEECMKSIEENKKIKKVELTLNIFTGENINAPPTFIPVVFASEKHSIYLKKPMFSKEILPELREKREGYGFSEDERLTVVVSGHSAVENSENHEEGGVYIARA